MVCFVQVPAQAGIVAKSSINFVYHRSWFVSAKSKSRIYAKIDVYVNLSHCVKVVFAGVCGG